MKQIGHIIQELRKEKGLTQARLVALLGFTQDSVSLWERDKRIPDTPYIVEMAKLFEVTSDCLLGLAEF